MKTCKEKTNYKWDDWAGIVDADGRQVCQIAGCSLRKRREFGKLLAKALNKKEKVK